MKIKIEAWGKSHRGQKRNSNQDSMLIDPELGLYIVADGMGGMGGPQGGEIASNLAVTTAQKIAQEAKARGEIKSPREFITEIYRVANEKIYQRSQEEGERLKGMGTTMVLAYQAGNDLYIGNVGDSRCYYFACPYLWQVTEDHSLINEQIRAGLIKESQRPTAFGKNLITRSVGYDVTVDCDIIAKALRPGDIFLMCSDGLSGLVSDERISDILVSVPINQVAERCVQEANWSGGDDNVTTLVLRASENV